MRRIVELEDIDLLILSQDYLEADSFREIIESINNKGLKKAIIPVRDDIVRDKSVIFDGHHISCLASLYREIGDDSLKLYSWIARNENDSIENLDDTFYQEMHVLRCNHNISRKWYTMREEVETGDNPKNIFELRRMYKELESMDTFRKFIRDGKYTELTKIDK